MLAQAHNDIPQLLGHQRSTTADICLSIVAPNLNNLAGD